MIALTPGQLAKILAIVGQHRVTVTQGSSPDERVMGTSLVVRYLRDKLRMHPCSLEIDRQRGDSGKDAFDKGGTLGSCARVRRTVDADEEFRSGGRAATSRSTVSPSPRPRPGAEKVPPPRIGAISEEPRMVRIGIPPTHPRSGHESQPVQHPARVQDRH